MLEIICDLFKSNSGLIDFENEYFG